jgi:hypothetical protein
MQKTTIKASILIWAIFLSLIISITFISISTKINKNIKNNSNFTTELEIENKIKNSINSGSISGIYKNQTLQNSDELTFESSTKFESSLKKNEDIEIKFPEISNITINLTNSWVIFYETLTSSGIINTQTNINPISWTIYIKNIGWYTTFEVNSDKSFTTKYKKYKIIKQIWNKKIIKQNWEIKNF